MPVQLLGAPENELILRMEGPAQMMPLLPPGGQQPPAKPLVKLKGDGKQTDFTAEGLRQAARTRWLSVEEVHFILKSPQPLWTVERERLIDPPSK